MATGVLPVFVGRATRAAEFCENAEKEYIAEIKLGIITDTQDITGNILKKNSVTVSVNTLADILPLFRGEQKQIPPMYSAVKQDGKKLYELARKGIEVERKARDIFISELELLSTKSETDYTLRIACSKGTYIRTLCHDIGAALGCGATLSALRRTRAGAYGIDKTVTLDKISTAASSGTLANMLLPVDSIFSEILSITLGESDSRKVKNGVRIEVSGCENGRYRVYAPNGEFLLLGDVRCGQLHSVKTFFEV
jgi:tRNA pseudouridine55 synthase